MIRFIMRCKEKHTSGAESERLTTFDADVPMLEQALKAGGVSEDAYEFHELIGVEVLNT